MADEKQNEIKPVASPDPIHSPVVETLTGDIVNAIGGDVGSSSVKNIIHGEEARQEMRKSLSPQSKKNKIYMFIGFLLLAFAVLIVVFLLSGKNTATTSKEQQSSPLVYGDRFVPLEISGLKKEDIVKKVLSEVKSTNVAAGGIEGIYLTENKQTIGLRRFLALMAVHFVPDNDALIVSDDFMTGVVKAQATTPTASGTGVFILMKVRSEIDVFDSLRAWEPNLFADLRGFFGINISSDTSYLLTKDFTDGIVGNKNARILYDKDGNIVLMYVFANDNSVLITDSQNAAREIILHLSLVQTE